MGALHFRPGIAVSCLLVIAATPALAQQGKTKSKASGKAAQASQAVHLPYLGPGTDLLPPDEYLETYKRYIQESVRLGFPPDKCTGSTCEQSLAHLFRMAGLFYYPVPSGADVKVWKHKHSGRECYANGGVVAQVEREKGGALQAATIIYSKSPKAAKVIERACRTKLLEVKRDVATGLERVAGVPVGYPHPQLCPASQGLFVRSLNFNDSRTACRPTEFADNAWVSGMSLTEQRCRATQQDLKLAWQGKLSHVQFAQRERERQLQRAEARAMAKGASKKEAQKMVKRFFHGPLDHPVTYTGMAMRNLETCNLLAIGFDRESINRARGSSSGAGEETSSGGRATKGSKGAR